ncbi:hypothetical protein [Sphingomicrobium astaxanthinifaciens]|uniref:hypothetical protein n=1 Tax=Sphingomicrobium astaxanthinifaciens TaxID=1227949 RepID=UPI001FCADDCD|nr:hypothetical protein [Sphingomicrobium astaxanthinifaciens]MCJ7421788.1 hypothetical protein [Sphingomicrobium astaxanthinifaciens]
MRQADRIYYLKRAEQECELAQSTHSPAAERAHREMARYYTARALHGEREAMTSSQD